MRRWLLAGLTMVAIVLLPGGISLYVRAQSVATPDIPPPPVADPAAATTAPKAPVVVPPVAKAAPKAAAPKAAPASPQPKAAASPKPVAPAKPAAAAAAPAKAATPLPKPVPAKELFGHQTAPANLAARAIGSYAKGCLAGAVPLAIDGPAWQAMRLSRNRFWGHPLLVSLVEKLAKEAQAHDGWPGLLVGDISQPRGGPMLTGHASHQIGLDADIWLMPMPPRRLEKKEREEMSAISVLRADNLAVDPTKWTEAHVKLIRRAASYPEVERVLVHPAIKKAMCDGVPADPARAAWLKKVRPIWGHHYHFHIRMGCPAENPTCRAQFAVAPPPTDADGCGKELADWMKLLSRPPPPPLPPGTPAKPPPPPPPPLTLDQLPTECKIVLEAGR
ncbi:MAG TPA: penicillin-insensitive murein endopeptidase [Hyphomicrobiaceae bacterium]|nr:penicillin-insensitive murein endopeptidase [Hyphomicrobiaceae bacterium]